MTKTEDLVANTIMVADGEIVGRVRLQKVFYLLEQLGLGSGLKFSYHHYGPYSRELDQAVDAAKAFNAVKEITSYRQSDGAAFSRFVVEPAGCLANDRLGELAAPVAKSQVQAMKDVTSTVIELAATIHWLVEAEGIRDWRPELTKRKGVKSENGRADQALVLLKRLGLAETIPN
jgi:uncharacterized protein